MPIVYSRDGEPFEITLKRFKKKCEKAAILSDIKKHQAYEKPSEERKRKQNVAKRKAMKIARKMQQYS
ncbi:MAG: 30S ribosomal protein S21 [Candidatus Cloacimonetes bacterium]|nr:30S ribosomal protein S21 [Candidatus Cloacimonadota bacterium]